METQIKVIVEKHADGYVAYPLGVKGVVVGQGDSYQAALDDVRSAIAFHVETGIVKLTSIKSAKSAVDDYQAASSLHSARAEARYCLKTWRRLRLR